MSTSCKHPSSPSPADQTGSEKEQTGAVPLMEALCKAWVSLSCFKPKHTLDFELDFCLLIKFLSPQISEVFEKSLFKKKKSV